MIKVHSLTDLITNSSTTIYTYHQNTPIAFINMIDEIFVLMGEIRKCRDVFNIMVLCEGYHYPNYLNEHRSDFPDLDEDQVMEILKGIKEPTESFYRLNDCVHNHYDNQGWHPTQSFVIRAKDPKYDKLVKMVTAFLGAPDCDATF